MLRRMSLARQVFALQLVLILLLVAVGTAFALIDARNVSEEAAERRVLTLGSALAVLPEVLDGFGRDDPATALGPVAAEVRASTGTDFVVFMSPAGLRYTHPDPERVGETFVGTIAPAAAGGRVVESYEGTLGPSVRAVVPVTDEAGSVVGLVSVGLLRSQLGQEFAGRLPRLTAIAAGAVAVAALGSFAVSRRIRSQTLGLGPVEITRMYELHDAVLHAVREGLVIVDTQGRLLLANDEAVRLLDLPDDAEGRPVADLGVDEPLGQHLARGERATDRLVVAHGRVLVVSSETATRDGRVLGTVSTLRDQTELEALTGELDSAKGFAEALRAQVHESANRLHAVVTMIELGRPAEAVEFATVELASAQSLADQVTAAIDEPAITALLLGKAAQAHERGVELVVAEDTDVRGPGIGTGDLVTVVGNLVDNAIDAAADGEVPRRVTVSAVTSDDELVLTVTDSGSGVEAGRIEEIFRRGWSTKEPTGRHGRGIGLALVRQVVERHGGSVAVARDPETVFTVRLPHARGGADG